MGDARFSPAYTDIRDSPNRIAAIRKSTDEEVIAALAGASRDADSLVANFLATEAMNRTLLGRAILEGIPEAVIALDREGRVTFLNPAAERMLGELREERIGHVLAPDAQLDGSPVSDALLAPVKDGAPHEYDHVPIATRDGRQLDAHVSSSPLSIHGTVTGVVLVVKESP